MNPSELAILAAHDVTLLEYEVLDAVHSRTTLPRNEVADYAVFFSAEMSFALSEFEAAATICLEKGWLKVLTPEDCEQDRLRWQNDLNQYNSEHEYDVGDVDFTPEGARLFYSIFDERAALENSKPYQGSIGYAWNEPGKVRIFGAYDEDVKSSVEEIEAGEFDDSEDPFRIERIEGPYAIGPWWINRFVQLPQGYRANVYYTRGSNVLSLESPEAP